MESVVLKTKQDILKTAFSYKSVQTIFVSLIILFAVRLFMQTFSLYDILAAAIVFILVGPVEWSIHKNLLHAKEHSYRMTRLKTGVSHMKHHKNPNDLQWVFLSGKKSFMYIIIILVSFAIILLPILLYRKTEIYVTVVLTSVFCLLHYEIVHLIAHSRYVPKTKRYRKLKKNHLLHHHRDSNTNLGVTSNLGDKIMKTL